MRERDKDIRRKYTEGEGNNKRMRKRNNTHEKMKERHSGVGGREEKRMEGKRLRMKGKRERK